MIRDACLCQFAEAVTILHLDGQWYLLCTFINALWLLFKASVAFYGNLISTITRKYPISLNALLKSSWQRKRILLCKVKRKCSFDNLYRPDAIKHETYCGICSSVFYSRHSPFSLTSAPDLMAQIPTVWSLQIQKK